MHPWYPDRDRTASSPVQMRPSHGVRTSRPHFTALHPGRSRADPHVRISTFELRPSDFHVISLSTVLRTFPVAFLGKLGSWTILRGTL